MVPLASKFGQEYKVLQGRIKKLGFCTKKELRILLRFKVRKCLKISLVVLVLMYICISLYVNEGQKSISLIHDTSKYVLFDSLLKKMLGERVSIMCFPLFYHALLMEIEQGVLCQFYHVLYLQKSSRVFYVRAIMLINYENQLGCSMQFYHAIILIKHPPRCSILDLSC